MLSITGLNFSYGNIAVFNDLSLEVSTNEHLVIVGDSGSGKSTLLDLIANKHSAVSRDNNASATMVQQKGALLDHLNVIENLNLVNRYTKPRVDSARISELLEQLNIDSSLQHAPISQLSGGQIRRVAIARALLTEPKLILFDEPDAGLDIGNLISLANTINSLCTEQGKTCVSVSHNPFYIASVAHKVYRLRNGQLEHIANWADLPTNDEQRQDRQLFLQAELAKEAGAKTSSISRAKGRNEWPFVSWVKGLASTFFNLFHWPRSARDEVHIAAYTTYLSLITGVVFFALVGLMLGATTMAVVRMLSDNALSGWVGVFIKPETLVSMMGGRYVLYLAPSIGAMLFVARSGSIMGNWLGEMTRSGQVRALELSGVPKSQYLAAPACLALFFSMFATVSWFAFCVWAGGVVSTYQLFDLSNTHDVMALTMSDLSQSLILTKTAAYSALVALTVVSLGLAPKKTAHQVNIHTTKMIIYSTLSVALLELVIILM